MSHEARTETLEDRRKQTLAELESALGTDSIGSEEYRRRADLARNATDEAELDAARPAPRGRDPRPEPTRPSHAVPVASGDDTGFVFACMGASVRKGPWEPPETLYALSLMGGINLDFREAALLEGVTEVSILALMGGVKIVVPDDVDVEVNGIGIMGSFEHVSHHAPGDARPLVRIKGLALMGGVEVKVKPAPGSTPARRLAKRARELL